MSELVLHDAHVVAYEEFEVAGVVGLVGAHELPNFHVEIWWDAGEYRGFFEHHEWGDECGGGLWIEPGVVSLRDGCFADLVDYDGVCALPREIALFLQAAGVRVDPVELS